VNRCFIGDCRDTLRDLISQGVKVQTCVTSPPYWGLRDYGVAGQIGLEATPEEWLERMVEVFRLVRDLLADDGTLWVNMGDAYCHGTGKDRKPTTTAGNRVPASWSNRSQPQRIRPSSDIKPKDLIGQPWMLAFALRADGWYLRRDIIWCLSGGTRVYARTQKGEMPMTIKDLVRLRTETVQLWNGEKWTQVLGWSETPREETVEIRLRSGEVIGCTPHHEWPTQRGRVAASDLRVGDVIDSTVLPEPESAKSPALIPNEVGRFIGLYLAEGSRSGGTIQIASHVREHDREAFLRELAEQYGGSVHVHRTSPSGMTINVESRVLSALVDTYVGGRVARDKHLKVECWKRSNAFLSEVLRGYLEGDGHYDEKNTRWRLGFTGNDALAADLRTLAARLGVGLRLSRASQTSNGRTFPGWRGELRFEKSGHHNEKPDTEVVAIGRSRARKFWHIGVADAPHTFALASGVLTCNSKPNPMPETVSDRPTTAHEYVFLLSKQPRYYYDAEAIKEPATGGAHTRGSGVNPKSRSWKTPDGWDTSTGTGGHGSFHKEGREKGKTDYEHKTRPRQNESFSSAVSGLVDNRNKRSVWTIPTKPFPGAHFATYPPELIEPCILAGSSLWACASCGRSIPRSEYENTEEMPGVRQDIRSEGKTEGEILLQDLLVQGNSQNAAIDKGLCHRPEGIQADSRPGSSDGEPGGVCDGAQAGDGESDWSESDGATSGPSRQRQQTGQQAREFGIDAQTRARQKTKATEEADSVSALRGRNNRVWSCPSCGCREKRPSIILDPFFGSGTTGEVAQRLGRQWIGCEINPEYEPLQRQRTAQHGMPL